MYPENYKYTNDHEWVSVEGDTGTVGITDYAQKEMGDIVFVELPEIGQEIKAGETMGNIESVKAVSELFSPVTGTVLEVNQALEDNAEMVNKDPHGSGWIVKIRLADPGELDGLMDAAAYGSLAG